MAPLIRVDAFGIQIECQNAGKIYSKLMASAVLTCHDEGRLLRRIDGAKVTGFQRFDDQRLAGPQQGEENAYRDRQRVDGVLTSALSSAELLVIEDEIAHGSDEVRAVNGGTPFCWHRNRFGLCHSSAKTMLN